MNVALSFNHNEFLQTKLISDHSPSPRNIAQLLISSVRLLPALFNLWIYGHIANTDYRKIIKIAPTAQKRQHVFLSAKNNIYINEKFIKRSTEKITVVIYLVRQYNYIYKNIFLEVVMKNVYSFIFILFEPDSINGAYLARLLKIHFASFFYDRKWNAFSILSGVCFLNLAQFLFIPLF